MEADARIAPLARLIADPTRATLLWALADGRSLPACDLALQARVGAPTISFHLGKLIAGGLVEAEKQGRHRYYRLADPSIVALLEKLAVLAPPSLPARSFAEGQNGRKLRFARSCYDHLAGRAGVALAEALVAAGHLAALGGDYQLSAAGERFFAELGIDLEAARASRRAFARRCLDWSERRHHLAGAHGAALLDLLFRRAFVQRAAAGRALLLTAAGRRFLDDRLGLRLEP